MQLTKREARRIVKLLGVLQETLESTIECMIVPETGEPDPNDAEDCAEVARLRKELRQAERLIARLTKCQD
jgi:hypothetical protein